MRRASVEHQTLGGIAVLASFYRPFILLPETRALVLSLSPPAIQTHRMEVGYCLNRVLTCCCLPLGRDGGTGRRSGLKIRRGLSPRGGSTPPPGTIP